MKKMLLVAVVMGLTLAAIGCGPAAGSGSGPAKGGTPAGGTPAAGPTGPGK